MKRVTHTHRGHCQACGAIQAVSTHRGLMAKHGYNVKYNYFIGICDGSDKLPLQKSKDFCEYMQKYCLENAARHEARITALRSGAEIPEVCRTGHRFDKTLARSVDLTTPWESATRIQQLDEIDKCVREATRAMNYFRDHAAFLARLAGDIFGTELLPVVRPKEIGPGSVVIWYNQEYTVEKIEMKYRGWRMQAYVVTTTGKSFAKRQCKLKV